MPKNSSKNWKDTELNRFKVNVEIRQLPSKKYCYNLGKNYHEITYKIVISHVNAWYLLSLSWYYHKFNNKKHVEANAAYRFFIFLIDNQ